MTAGDGYTADEASKYWEHYSGLMTYIEDTIIADRARGCLAEIGKLRGSPAAGLLDLPADKFRCLDYGCGSGEAYDVLCKLMPQLSGSYAWYTGMDPSPAMIGMDRPIWRAGLRLSVGGFKELAAIHTLHTGATPGMPVGGLGKRLYSLGVCMHSALHMNSVEFMAVMSSMLNLCSAVLVVVASAARVNSDRVMRTGCDLHARSLEEYANWIECSGADVRVNCELAVRHEVRKTMRLETEYAFPAEKEDGVDYLVLAATRMPRGDSK